MLLGQATTAIVPTQRRRQRRLQGAPPTLTQRFGSQQHLCRLLHVPASRHRPKMQRSPSAWATWICQDFLHVPLKTLCIGVGGRPRLWPRIHAAVGSGEEDPLHQRMGPPLPPPAQAHLPPELPQLRSARGHALHPTSSSVASSSESHKSASMCQAGRFRPSGWVQTTPCAASAWTSCNVSSTFKRLVFNRFSAGDSSSALSGTSRTHARDVRKRRPVSVPLQLPAYTKASSIVAPPKDTIDTPTCWIGVLQSLALFSLSRLCLRLLSCARRAPWQQGQKRVTPGFLSALALAPSRQRVRSQSERRAIAPTPPARRDTVKRHLRRPEPSDAHGSGGPVGLRPRPRHLAAAATPRPRPPACPLGPGETPPRTQRAAAGAAFVASLSLGPSSCTDSIMNIDELKRSVTSTSAACSLADPGGSRRKLGELAKQQNATSVKGGSSG